MCREESFFSSKSGTEFQREVAYRYSCRCPNFLTTLAWAEERLRAKNQLNPHRLAISIEYRLVTDGQTQRHERERERESLFAKYT